MQLFRIVAVSAAALCGIALGQAGAEANYNAMVQRVKSGDMTVDFRAMRFACMAVPVCRPRATKAELQALVSTDHRQAIALGNKILDQGYVNAEVHATVAGHYQSLGSRATPDERAKASFHQGVMVALVRSMITGRDGRTPETAFEVISDREQYMVLATLSLPYAGPGVKTENVTLNGHKFARWQIQNALKQTVTLYFNTDAFQAKSVIGKE